MNLRTDISPKYLLRMGLVGLFCLGAGGWFLYDGMFTYPAQQKQAKAFIEFETEHAELGQKQLFDQWKEVAAEKGWPAGIAGKEITPYGKPKKDYDINGQFYFAGLAGFIGLIFLSKFLGNRGCWIEADDSGLRSSENREVKFDQITALNKRQWQNKGIARVLYEVDGRKKKIVLDDCNYDRDTTNAILRHVEAAIGPDKITNGKPEPPLKKPTEKPVPANGDAASAAE